MESKTTDGVVKAVRKDKKGVQLDSGDWFSHFLQQVNCNKGDKVKIEYTENESNGRVFKNWNKITVLESSNNSDDNTQMKNASVMMSYAKDIACNKINSGASFCKNISEFKEFCAEIEAEMFVKAEGFMELQKHLAHEKVSEMQEVKEAD